MASPNDPDMASSISQNEPSIVPVSQNERSVGNLPFSIFPVEIWLVILEHLSPADLLNFLLVNKEVRGIVLGEWRRGRYENKGLLAIKIYDVHGCEIEDERSLVDRFKWLVFHEVLTDMRRLVAARKDELGYQENPQDLFAKYGETSVNLLSPLRVHDFRFVHLLQTLLKHPTSLNEAAFRKMQLCDIYTSIHSVLTKLAMDAQHIQAKGDHIAYSRIINSGGEMFSGINGGFFNKKQQDAIHYLSRYSNRAVEAIIKNFDNTLSQHILKKYDSIPKERIAAMLMVMAITNQAQLLEYFSPVESFADEEKIQQYMQFVIATFDFEVLPDSYFLKNARLRVPLLQELLKLHRYQTFFALLEREPLLLFDLCKSGAMPLLDFILYHKRYIRLVLNDLENDKGNSLLHAAVWSSVKFKTLDMIRCLFWYGVDGCSIDLKQGKVTFKKNKNGNTPIAFASIYSGSQFVIDELKGYLAQKQNKLNNELQKNAAKQLGGSVSPLRASSVFPPARASEGDTPHPPRCARRPLPQGER